MRVIAAIARNTFREALRDRILEARGDGRT
jgi:hypothetical protein